jgi:hypothetical protein
MRQFIMMLAALTAFGGLVATAQAEVLGGAPNRNGNQCFKHHGISKDSRFGYWEACPQAANTRASASQRRSGAAASLGSRIPRSVDDYEHESAQ